MTTNAASDALNEPAARTRPVAEFGFIPDALRSQCRSLIKSYHAMHGYSCLPNILWKAGLSGFIEKHRNLREALKKASTTRSARTANDHFVMIATEVLSLEVLAREYANWSAILPAAKITAIELLDAGTPTSRTWLMEHYLYPPRYDSPVAKITLPQAATYGAANDPLGDLPEARSFRDIVLARRREQLAKPPAREPEDGVVLAAQDSSET